MARDSLTIDPKSGNVAANGTAGFFLGDIRVQRLAKVPWETLLGTKCMVTWK